MNVRPATVEDVSLILLFIEKRSEFDRYIGAFSGVLQVSEDKIRKTLFGKIPCIWLDDLLVEENSRGRGAGLMLMNYLAKIALEYDCTHLGWTADARNVRGLNFYSRLGAEILEKQGNRCFLKWVPSG